MRNHAHVLMMLVIRIRFFCSCLITSRANENNSYRFVDGILMHDGLESAVYETERERNVWPASSCYMTKFCAQSSHYCISHMCRCSFMCLDWCNRKHPGRSRGIIMREDRRHIFCIGCVIVFRTHGFGGNLPRNPQCMNRRFCLSERERTERIHCSYVCE